MKTTVKLISVAALVFAASLSMAQGRMRMFGGGGMSQSMLLGRGDVQAELKLSDDVKGKLEDMRNAMMEEMRNSFQSGGGDDREAMMKQMQERMKKADTEALALLNDGQKKRLKELWVQRSGNRIVTNEDVAKELGLTDDQKGRIRDLVNAQQQAMNEIFEKMRNGELDRSEMRPLMDKNNKALEEEIGKVLTDGQKSKLKEMGGAPFTFDEDGA